MNYVLGSRATMGYVLGRGAGAAAGGLPVAGAGLWLDASQITGLSDGGSVTTWTDASASANNATGSGASAPTYKSGILNGKPVVRFDGGDILTLGSAVTVDSQSIFIVFTPSATITAASSAQALIMSNATYGGYIALGAVSGALANERLSWYRVSGGFAGYAQNTADISGNQILSVRWNDSTATATMRLNGADALKSSAGGGFTGATNPIAYQYIGAYNTPSVFFNGDIAEIIIYNSALSDGDQGLVEAYLGTKYGITVI